MASACDRNSTLRDALAVLGHRRRLHGCARVDNARHAQHRDEPAPLAIADHVAPRVRPARRRVPDEIEHRNLARPHRAPLERLGDGHRFDERGLASVHVSDCVVKRWQSGCVHGREPTSTRVPTEARQTLAEQT